MVCRYFKCLKVISQDSINALNGTIDVSLKIKTFVYCSSRHAFERSMMLLIEFSKIGIENLNML